MLQKLLLNPRAGFCVEAIVRPDTKIGHKSANSIRAKIVQGAGQRCQRHLPQHLQAVLLLSIVAVHVSGVAGIQT